MSNTTSTDPFPTAHPRSSRRALARRVIAVSALATLGLGSLAAIPATAEEQPEPGAPDELAVDPNDIEEQPEPPAPDEPAVDPNDAEEPPAPDEPAVDPNDAEEPPAADEIPTDAAAAIERLRAEGLLVEHEPAATHAVPISLASQFGIAFMKGAFGQAGSQSLSAALAAMGYDPDSGVTAALAEIRSAITQLSSQISGMQRQLEALLVGQDYTNFYNSHREASAAAGQINMLLRSVADWNDRDLEVDPANVAAARLAITSEMTRLMTHTTDSQTGVVPLMMKASQASGVSDLEDYYARIDETRDYYRAVYAQGIAALELLERWDTDGTVGSARKMMAEDSIEAVLRAYSFGLMPPRPDEAPIVHPRHADYILAGGWPDGQPSDGWQRMHARTPWLEPILQSMAASYRPADHGGATLEQYLTARGIPTKYVYMDTFHDNYSSSGNGILLKIHLRSRANYGEIRGNEYVTGHFDVASRTGGQDLCESGYCDMWFQEQRAKWRPAAEHMTSEWTNRFDHDSRLLRRSTTTEDVAKNAAGWAAQFDPDLVEQAAFPEA